MVSIDATHAAAGTPTRPKFTLAERVLIVPAAHARLASATFQLEMYELFHRSAGGRLGHMIGTPSVLFGSLMLVRAAAGGSGGAAPWVAGALMGGIALWGAVIDRLAGLVTAVAGAALAIGAFALGAELGARSVAVGAALVLGGCAVQTFSHLFEDVPPPQSGTTEFVPLSAWLRRVDAREALRSAALTFAVFYWLELWASLRIWPLQVLHLLLRAGHRPDLRRQLDARVAEIVAEPTSDWRQPRG